MYISQTKDKSIIFTVVFKLELHLYKITYIRSINVNDDDKPHKFVSLLT